jgi:glycosyltransferase involved in cell wall biosynthesis
MRPVIYTSWNLNPSLGTGVAVALASLRAELDRQGIAHQFIHETYEMGNFAIYFIKRTLANLRFAWRCPPGTDVLMGIDFDGCFVRKGQLRYVLNLRSNFASIKLQEKGLMYLIARAEEFLQKIACKKADLIITATQETRAAAIRQYRLPAARVVVIPNGIARDWKLAPAQKPPAAPVILSVAALYPRKGMQYLLPALALLKRRGVPFKHIHVGGGVLLASFMQQAKKLGLQDQVEFAGPVADRSRLMAYYQNCRVFCHPCLHEDFGNVFLEAMSQGRPVVAFDNSGAREIIRPEFGIKVKDGSIEELAAALESLLLDYELCNRMGEAARAAVQEYDWSSTARSFIRQFEILGAQH